MAVLEGGQKTRPQVMGIINATPDSFHKSSREGTIEKAMKMIADGADWIDIGGKSTRPGADKISIDEELSRVIPLVTEISKHANVSIDTRNVEVAKQALQAGAKMVNDVSGLRDPNMLDLIVEHGCHVCIMHMLGEPGNMQDNPEYQDVSKEVNEMLLSKARELVEREHSMDRIHLDPGIGFGKTLEHNYALLKHLSSIQMDGVPMLIGVSRKSMIYKLLQIEVAEAGNGTSVLNTVALQQGAQILRVHDVKDAHQAVQLIEKLKNA